MDWIVVSDRVASLPTHGTVSLTVGHARSCHVTPAIGSKVIAGYPCSLERTSLRRFRASDELKPMLSMPISMPLRLIFLLITHRALATQSCFCPQPPTGQVSRGNSDHWSRVPLPRNRKEARERLSFVNLIRECNLSGGRRVRDLRGLSEMQDKVMSCSGLWLSASPSTLHLLP